MGATDFFKGLARGGLADLVGGPVDLAQQVANLGIMGVGLAGHKLGLLTPEQMPMPLEGSVGTSDWFAKGTPLQDPGTESYTRGRLAANFAPLAYSAAKMLPRAPHGQVNALFPGGDPELIVAHGKGELNLRNGELSREFTNLSNAVTRNRLSHEFGSNFFIPREGQFDPKTDNTVLRLHDFYTARRGAGSRIDAARYDLSPGGVKSSGRTREDILKGLADARLADKFYTQFGKGGLWSENVPPVTQGLPRFGEKGPQARMPTLDSFHSFLTSQSPAFQSFRHFENSPLGAPLLGQGSASSAGHQLGGTTRQLLRPIENATGRSLVNSDNGLWLKRFASGLWNPGEPNSEPLNYSQLYLTHENSRNMTPAEIQQVQTTAREILGAAKKIPSNYAELKSWGTTPIAADRFAGILVPENTFDLSAIKAAGGRRGIPVESYVKGDEFAQAVQMQKDAHKRPFLMRGLGDSKLPVSAAKKSILDAQPKTAPVEPGNFQNLINYVNKPWKGGDYPSASQLQKDFNISEDQANVLSDLAFAHSMKGKYGAHWQQNIDASLAELAKWTQPKIPVGQATELAGFK